MGMSQELGLENVEVYEVKKDQKLNLASLFLVDKADSWFHNWIKSEGRHEWEDFEKYLCVGFREEEFEDVMEEIMKLRQEGMVEEY